MQWKTIVHAAAAVVLSLSLAGTALARDSADFSEGEVRKVNRETSKITIRHGPLQNLGMPPMTMVFQVRDPALLDRLQAGDKIRFRAEQSGAEFFVTEISKGR